MTTAERLFTRVGHILNDQEFPRLTAGLTAAVRLTVGDRSLNIKFEDQCATIQQEVDDIRVSVKASEGAWEILLQSPPPPTFHSFTALQLVNNEFEISGDPLWVARCRPALERLIERLVDSPVRSHPTPARNIEQIVAGYRTVRTEESEFDLYVEHAGQGIPVLFLHTAGADSRQFLGQMADIEMAQSYSMWAVDMPFHGKSLPPLCWNGATYTLTSTRYLSWCVAMLEQVIKTKAIIVGGSMGAAMTMMLAAKRPDLVAGIVAVEPPFRSTGRRNPFQHHAEIHGAMHNASFVRGLMSPESPEANRRRAAWIYSQGAPGVYGGDLAFYSDEFDGAVIGPQIDTTKTPVTLLSGTYDYSATPEDGQKLQSVITGSTLEIMEGLGHFPMCEHPDLFRPHLLKALERIWGG
ncbi:alpha/beta hydrolase [Herbaspirillum sp. RTI4]|uniref:alpha/beta fold hydrolase n=1 Tax=Herbaspirillum sp. RTI4 TaxID=3048640 RepID=UPI002AB34C5D|nr:alpha/beta hydrolase [Herbaspirillum sp. RTI4]MDY7577696.1 alpha/beta hydrolase [Herbaspirillum sp. RTI4]MEA9980876.1 alpha/beta hydrolase [Herbaspirillum sp. RTI4]